MRSGQQRVERDGDSPLHLGQPRMGCGFLSKLLSHFLDGGHPTLGEMEVLARDLSVILHCRDMDGVVKKH